MLVSVSSTVQFKQLTVYKGKCTVLYSLAQVHFFNQIMYMENIHIAKLMAPGKEPFRFSDMNVKSTITNITA